MTLSPSPSGGPYGLRDVRSLYPAVTDAHLRYLRKWGLLDRPDSDAREYSFPDLLTIRHVAAELERGTPLRTILRALLAARQGQLRFDFHAGHAGADRPRAKVVSLEARKPRADSVPGSPYPADVLPLPYANPQAALAAKYFGEASILDDGDDQTMAEAAAAYRKALIVDPDLVPAIVNLANIHYSRDELIEAQALYERAVRLDHTCFEAHFNLGNIQHDLGRLDHALACYRAAVSMNPGYADAHFYLAVTLEKAGQSPDAKPHWKAYLDLAPEGEWADLAWEFLE